MGKGLYGQLQGNEKRTDAARMTDQLADNELVEGHETATLQRMFREQDFKAFGTLYEELRRKGWSKTRLDSIVSRATTGRI
jgi:hypothetical protein